MYLTESKAGIANHSASFIINVYSHNFEVSGFNNNGKLLLMNYCRNFVVKQKTVSHGKANWIISSVFAAANKNRTYFRFHFNQLNDLLNYLETQGFPSHTVKIIKHLPPEGEIVNFKVKSTKEPRDYQFKAIDYVSNLIDTFLKIFKLVVLQTGKGKTFIALSGMAKINKRVLEICKPMYIEKWIADFEEFFSLRKSDIMVVKGSKNFKIMLDLAKAKKLDAKIIIISNRTYYDYLEDWERFNGKGLHDVHPNDLCKILKVGYRLIDEVHQDFHLNFRCDLYTNVESDVSLSATMDPDAPILKTMYEIMFPTQNRFKGIPYDKYIDVKSIFYSANDAKKIKCKRFGLGFYSQVMFEESIMRDRVMMENYLFMISSIVKKEFFNSYEEGKKFIVFAGTIAMATAITTRLNRDFPQYNIKRYVGEDDYQTHLLDPVGRVSTLKSAGTAIDIDDLLFTLMTDAHDSTQGNEQVLGRTRKSKGKFSELTPVFAYLSCQHIQSHVKYDEKKRKVFDGKVLSHSTAYSDFRI